MKSKTEILIEVAWGIGVSGYVISTLVHIIAAMVYLTKIKRGTFEWWAIVLFMAAAWPLFSVGMMIDGYKAFQKKIWGDP